MFSNLIKNRLFFYITIVIIGVFAVYFRTHLLEGKLTFEWDQARDYEAVASMLRTGEPPLLGPIVRGDAGGFYLGPLYYYLITPVYVLSGGNPVSLAVVSIGADVLTIILLALLFSPILGRVGVVAAGILWAGSPLLIGNSYTAWNVTLIPLWTMLYLYYHLRLTQKYRFRDLWVFVFLSSLTTNIHLSLIPVIGIFLLYHYKLFFGRSLKEYLSLALAAILPVITLIIHDLTHGFENTILLKRFLFGTASRGASLIEIAGLVIDKYGYTLGRLLTGEPYTLLGWVALFILLFVAYRTKQARSLAVGGSLVIGSILFSLLIYRDTDFAEYYFTATFIPFVLFFGLFFKQIFKSSKFLGITLFLALIIFSLRLGLNTRAKEISPYSLTVKKAVVNEIKNLDYPVEFRTHLPRERNTGFEYLLKQAGVASDPSAPRKAYVYEADNLEIIAPEEARSIILDKPVQAFKLIVFSN
jgi:hypothetical protein